MAAAQWYSLFGRILFYTQFYRDSGKEIYGMLCIDQRLTYIFGHIFSKLRSSQIDSAYGDHTLLFQICAKAQMGGDGRSGNDHFDAVYLYGRISDCFYALAGRAFYENAYRCFHADASVRRAGGCIAADPAFCIKKLCIYGKAEAVRLYVSIAAAVQLYRVGHPQRAWAGHVDGTGFQEKFFLGETAGTVGTDMDSGSLRNLLYHSEAGEQDSGAVRSGNGTEKAGGSDTKAVYIPGGSEKKE